MNIVLEVFGVTALLVMCIALICICVTLGDRRDARKETVPPPEDHYQKMLRDRVYAAVIEEGRKYRMRYEEFRGLYEVTLTKAQTLEEKLVMAQESLRKAETELSQMGARNESLESIIAKEKVATRFWHTAYTNAVTKETPHGSVYSAPPVPFPPFERPGHCRWKFGPNSPFVVFNPTHKNGGC